MSSTTNINPSTQQEPIETRMINSFSKLKPMQSSLPLQITLHLHIHFSPLIVIAVIGCAIMKFDYLHPTYRVILVAILIISITIELIRPYLGYAGNLGEKIPELSGFWILTSILQLPIAAFLLFNFDIYPLPLEQFLLGLHLCFLLIESVTSFLLIRILANRQVERFKHLIENDDKQRQAGVAIMQGQENLSRLLNGQFDVSVLPQNFVRTFSDKQKTS